MRTLTKLIAPALAATLALGAFAPAQAAPSHEKSRYEQTRNDQRGHYADSRRLENRYTASRNALIRSDINDLRRDIDRGASRRMISQREAAGLRRDADRIQRLYASYARGGLDSRELRTLQARVDRVQAALHREGNDRNGHRR